MKNGLQLFLGFTTLLSFAGLAHAAPNLTFKKDGNSSVVLTVHFSKHQTNHNRASIIDFSQKQPIIIIYGDIAKQGGNGFTIANAKMDGCPQAKMTMSAGAGASNQLAIVQIDLSAIGTLDSLPKNCEAMREMVGTYTLAD